MVVDTTLFQYCQKLIVLSKDRQSVLLAKRKGEADYNGTFTFIGGKMETTDDSLLAGMKREKDEEVGSDVRVAVLADESYNVLFRKKDGHVMVLPHIAALYVSGSIKLSDEYSEYQWVPVVELDVFEPKVANIPELARWAAQKLTDSNMELTEI
ncbi:MAG TPA: NUDIX domain-containing protein [Verrucomicrobiae bacterium]|nr:NUDIX domain-containing protein [Verrucomicrobiae bacterium]